MNIFLIKCHQFFSPHKIQKVFLLEVIFPSKLISPILEYSKTTKYERIFVLNKPLESHSCMEMDTLWFIDLASREEFDLFVDSGSRQELDSPPRVYSLILVDSGSIVELDSSLELVLLEDGSKEKTKSQP